MNPPRHSEGTHAALPHAHASASGRLYVLEGPDGVGKSTLAQAFFERLREAGVPGVLMAFPGTELGTLGRHVYELHQRPGDIGLTTIDPTSLQVLHIAAHIDAIERRIRPVLRDGQTIVLDRYWWSTWVYGLESGVSRASLKALIRLEREHWKDLVPDAIFLVQREVPFRAEHDPARFGRLNALYMDLFNESIDDTVHALANTNSVADAVSQMMPLVGEPREYSSSAAEIDRE